MPSLPDARGERLACLDWIRFLVVLLLAPFHAAISFTGMGSVYVYDTPVRDIMLSGGTPSGVGPLVLTEFSVFLDNWFMHLLFLVSGIAAAMALRKRSATQFLVERCSRLLLPLLLGTVMVVSVQSWLRAVSFGTYTGGFLAFFPSFFNGPYTGPHGSGNFDVGQLWFLGSLFFLSAITLPLMVRIRNAGDASRTMQAARRFAAMPFLLLPALWTGVLEALFRPGWPSSTVGPVVTLHLSFFLAGYLMAGVPELLKAVNRHRAVLLALGLGAFAARISVYSLFTVPDGYNAANVTSQFFRGAASYGLVMAAMGYGQRYLNRQGRALAVARDLSFPLYILHFVPLSAALYLLLGTGLSIGARWAIAVAASWACVALFTCLARHVPPLRWFFGIRRPRGALKRPA